jgi:hypothetical protein
LKKSNAASPVAVCGKSVTGVLRGQEMMATRRMGQRNAPLQSWN